MVRIERASRNETLEIPLGVIIQENFLQLIGFVVFFLQVSDQITIFFKGIFK